MRCNQRDTRRTNIVSSAWGTINQEVPKACIFTRSTKTQCINNWRWWARDLPLSTGLSSLTNLILQLENNQKISETGCALIVPLDSKEKWNQKSPLTVMMWECCFSFPGSGALDVGLFCVSWRFEIDTCDMMLTGQRKMYHCWTMACN
jgi:hypothetical protein